jgi:hypothetical protein
MPIQETPAYSNLIYDAGKGTIVALSAGTYKNIYNRQQNTRLLVVLFALT